MYKGIKGATQAVADFQQQLNKAGLYKDNIDGIWGTNTDAAYKKALDSGYKNVNGKLIKVDENPNNHQLNKTIHNAHYDSNGRMVLDDGTTLIIDSDSGNRIDPKTGKQYSQQLADTVITAKRPVLPSADFYKNISKDIETSVNNGITSFFGGLMRNIVSPVVKKVVTNIYGTPEELEEQSRLQKIKDDRAYRDTYKTFATTRERNKVPEIYYRLYNNDGMPVSENNKIDPEVRNSIIAANRAKYKYTNNNGFNTSMIQPGDVIKYSLNNSDSIVLEKGIVHSFKNNPKQLYIIVRFGKDTWVKPVDNNFANNYKDIKIFRPIT